MVECEDCGKEMETAETCDVDQLYINGTWVDRNTDHFDNNERCHDCGILNQSGNIHHFGCDIEKCPVCEGQLFICECEKDE